MKSLTKIFLALVLSMMAAQSFASVICHTPRMSKVFHIEENKVAVYQNDVAQGREIASSTQARTQYTHKGFTKVMQHLGHKITVHIEDSKNFSQVDDYLTIRDQQGHEISYPLNCYTK